MNDVLCARYVKLILLGGVITISAFSLLGFRGKAYANGGYPWADAVCVTTGQTTGKCPNYEWSINGQTRNGSTGNYYYRNCTDYVAWRLVSSGIALAKVSGLGNAGAWDNNAPSKGLSVSSSPTAGSVGVDERYGHVVFVESVNGSTLTISEYNWGSTGSYSARSGSVNQLGLSKFVSFGVSSSPATQQPPASSNNGLGSSLQFLGNDSLQPGQYIRPGQYIESANTKYVLVMQGDGNLVEYGDGMRVIWHTRTGGNPGAFAVFQGDGNFVVYSANWRPLWASGSKAGANVIALQTDANLVMYQNQTPRWANNITIGDSLVFKGTDYLVPGQVLGKNEYLRSSDKRYSLALLSNGDMVAFGPGHHPIWSSGTAGRGAYLYVQYDGNLVIYDVNYKPVWATTPKANPGRFYIQSDGNVVQYKLDWHPLWASGTGGRI